MKKIKLGALLLALTLIVGCFAGCGGNKQASSEALPYAINEMDVDVIDDLPDWSGEQLDLSVWYGSGTNNPSIGKAKKEDKFQAELKRVAGISFDEKTSFDNAGESCDAKIAKIVASKSWPHVGVGVEANVSTMLLDEDKIYDLSEYIPKYMPNYMSYVNSSKKIQREIDRFRHNGKIYAFRGLSRYSYRYLDPEFTVEKYEDVIPPAESRTFFWIRDDILKKLHPKAHTVKELQDIYMKNGDFTAEQITDFTIKSRDEFRQLLEDIDALNIVENGRKVWPFYLSEGTDNWSLLAQFDGLAEAGFSNGVDYFAYYDASKKKIVNPAKEKWFKDLVEFYNELFRDGLASEEAFVDTKAAFEQKKNNGEYVILYGNATPPTSEVLEAGGKKYGYRKVFIDIPVNHKRFLEIDASRLLADYGLIFFKDKVNETQLEQILRFLDFFYTDAGMKYAMYGPKKSGLYKENKDGTIEYTDKAFEDAMIYGGDDQVLFDYGYKSFPVITQFVGGSTDYFNKYNPKIDLGDRDNNKERVASNYINEYKISKVIPKAEYPLGAQLWTVYSFTGKVPGIKSMWDARQVIEDALKSVLASRSEKEFEKAYKAFVEIEERNGYDDVCFDEFNKVFNEMNSDYMDNIKNWKAK